jgi:hypothetical protein
VRFGPLINGYEQKELKHKHANNDEDNEPEPADANYQAPARRSAGAAVYLRVLTTTFGVKGRLIDDTSRVLPSDIVQFDDLAENLLARAIHQYDNFEQTRFSLRNRRMI